MPDCMCEFDQICGGDGVLDCRGCGGEFCCCAACFGQGITECPGCVDCCNIEAALEDDAVRDMGGDDFAFYEAATGKQIGDK